MVAARRDLPDLSAIVRRRRRRRRRRPARASSTASTTWRARRRRRCGCRRSSRRRWPTSATTSPTTATSTRSSATLDDLDALIDDATSAASGCCSTGCPTTPPSVTRGSWRRARAATTPSATGTCGATARPAADRRTTGARRSRRSGRAWTFDDATGQWYLHSFAPSSPISTGTTPRSRRRCTTCCGSGSTAASTASGIDAIAKIAKDPLLRDNAGAARRRDEDWDTDRTTGCAASGAWSTSTPTGCSSARSSCWTCTAS